MTEFWRGRRVLVTGASGFIGSHVVEALLARGAVVTAVVRDATRRSLHDIWGADPGRVSIAAADLIHPAATAAVCRGQEVIISAAHVDGSLTFKQRQPASIFRSNMIMTLNLLEGAREHGVERMLVMSSAEVYGDGPDAELPTVQIGPGCRWPATDGYAWSKLMSEFAAGLWQREYGLKVAIARPGNVYGPRDRFEPASVRVIPNFIQQALLGEGPIVVWGSGEQLRTFLYVEDFARGLLDLVERYPEGDPVDFGGTQQITVRALAELIVRLGGRSVPVVCDRTRPSGAGRRLPDTAKAQRVLGFVPTVALEDGLRRTIQYYRAQLAERSIAR